ncbi:hypothetical protein C9374_003873 [Naegleria lovaniensis]|uniref:Uncharacterized protein n=1 Tax=Naegleria lovaniensis TaxID=51637 RepID=A0AA88H0S1_NAELO|nr:uncharacterized protein C9374_003873 [Naegleria lovaniensis]KAG2394109.1 hypothetical protein C9374_003873 [Naegleria lovaniensis]
MLAPSSVKVDANGKCSLAFKQLRDVPSQMVFQALAPKVIELDLSHNNLTDVSENVNCLENLTSLVLDHNRIHSGSTFNGGKPMPKITLLWVNSNKIKDLKQFLEKVAIHFPNLKIFSMLKNEACPNFFTGGSAEQYEQYRLFVVSRLPNLQVLDSSTVTKSEREIAKKMYGNLDSVPSFILMQQQEQQNAESKQPPKGAANNTNTSSSNVSNLPNFGTLTSGGTPSQPSYNLPNISTLQPNTSLPPVNSFNSYTNHYQNNQSIYFSNNVPISVQPYHDLMGSPQLLGGPTLQNHNSMYPLPQPTTSLPMPNSNLPSQPGLQLPSLDSLAQKNQTTYRGPYL